jgi:hypothetical protein
LQRKTVLIRNPKAIVDFSGHCERDPIVNPILLVFFKSRNNTAELVIHHQFPDFAKLNLLFAQYPKIPDRIAPSFGLDGSTMARHAGITRISHSGSTRPIY